MQEKNILDMASAAKIMSKFSGKDGQSVDTWMRDFAMLYTTALLRDEITLKDVILALGR